MNNKHRRPSSRSGRRRPTVLGRDLLNLALIVAFLHVDPESYLGLNNRGSILNYDSMESDVRWSSKNIMADLSSLGDRYSSFFYNPPNSVEISAYILTNQNSSAVNNQEDNNDNNDNNSEHSYGGNPQSQSQTVNDDSGVSDVDSGHHSEYSASASPARLFELDEFVFQPGESDELLEPKEEILDVNELEQIVEEQEQRQQQQSQAAALPVAGTGGYEGLFQSEESTSIFQDLDQMFGNPVEQQNEVKVEEQQESMDFEEFAPNAEDVENQLMHIDDQLIRLDENIGHLDGHLGHLDEAATNTETLLSVDEETFLFESMPEVMDPFNLGDWNLEDNSEIDEMIAAGLPSPLMPSPFTNSNTEAVKDEEERDANNNTTVDAIANAIIKEEPLDLDELMFNDDGEAEIDLDNVKLEDVEAVEEPDHLADHNYALSAYEECFGADFKPTFPRDFEWEGGASASPSPSTSSSARARESRDERKAREIGLPFAVADIIDLPIDAFNELLTHHTLTEEQHNLCRDIRRRGKNKVAAQNCRKRKLDLISQLEEEVSRARHQKQVLMAEREELYRLRSEWSDKLMNLEAAVLRGLNKNVDEFKLDLSGPSVRVTPRLVKPTRG